MREFRSFRPHQKSPRPTRVTSLHVKPWPNGHASSRKWTQVELAQRLALGGQTDAQVSSQVHASHKKDILKQAILYFIG